MSEGKVTTWGSGADARRRRTDVLMVGGVDGSMAMPVVGEEYPRLGKYLTYTSSKERVHVICARGKVFEYFCEVQRGFFV